MRYDIYGYEVITDLECLPFENDEKYFLTLGIVEGCNPVRELNNVNDLFSGPSFCAGVVSCVQTWFASPGADGQTIIQELVQDSIGDVLEGFDYNDALNTWLQENPLSSADNISYDNTTSLLTATNVQDAIDEIIAGFCTRVQGCITANGLPTGIDLFTLDGNLIETGDVVTTTNSLSNAGLIITSTVNGVSDDTDITTAVQDLIDSSTDTVTDTVAGNKIATHTSVDGTVVDINETITTITPSANGFTYTSEDGSTDDVTFTITNAGTSTAAQEIRVNGTLVATIPLNQYDIQINNAGSDFDISDDSITITETNGDTATISFAKYNITADVTGCSALIYQNGNLIATVSKPVTVSGTSVAGNATGVFNDIQLRGENDTGVLNTPTNTVAQKVFRQVTQTACSITDTVIVENYVDNTIYVDLTYGNNATGLRERSDRPFATLAAAVLSSQPGDTIVLRNGSYALGTIAIPHNLNFMADEGVNIDSGVFTLVQGIVVKYKGGSFNTSSSYIFDVPTNSKIFVEGDEFNPTINSNLVRTSNSALSVNAEVYIKINNTNSVTNNSALLGINETTNLTASIDVENINNTGFIRGFRTVLDSRINITFDKYTTSNDTADYRAILLQPGSGLNVSNNIININGETVNTNDSTNAGFFYMTSINNNNIFNSNIKYFNGSRFLYDISENNSGVGNIHNIKGNQHIGTKKTMYYSNQAINTNLVFKNVLINLYVDYVYNSFDGGNTGWASSGTNGSILIVGHGSSANIFSKEVRSNSVITIGVDNTAISGVFDNLTSSIISVHGTNLVREAVNPLSNTVVDNAIIYVDQGFTTNTHPDIIINLYNGVTFTRNYDQTSPGIIVADTNTPTNVIVNIYNQITTNTPISYDSIDQVIYHYLPTSVIPTSGTFTVTTETNDYYYDLSLGSLTFVLPNPNKYINREIELKITGLHPTNTVTIDPVGANLIENVATRVVPNTATLYTGVTIKSQGGKRWIK